jgi:ribosome-associated protein
MRLCNYPEACTCFSPSSDLDGLTAGHGSTEPGARKPPPRTAYRSITIALGPPRVVSAQMEDPMPIGRHADIPLREIVLRTSRSSGPGGQHANVTASRVEASFDVASSSALSEEQKRRVIARTGPRVVAVAQDARSQSRNRELALERLRRRLTGALAVQPPRRATRPTQASVRRRLDAKRRQAQRKQGRGRPSPEE